jgi:protein ImuB
VSRGGSGAGASGAVRTLVVRCPSWPAVALGAGPGEPAAVLRANRVVAATPAAVAEGVEVGQRRREAQGRCPGLAVLERDEDREARAFEPVARAIEAFTPRIELAQPGVVAFPTRGPSRYFGGDDHLAALVCAQVDVELAALGWSGYAGVGVADGGFAAALAARLARPAGSASPPSPAGSASPPSPAGSASPPSPAGSASPTSSAGSASPAQGAGVRVVARGGSAAFLAPCSVVVLERPDLAQVLRRLGLRTLGDLAALDPGDVVGRFGAEGQRAHRLARGLDERPPATAPPPPELAVGMELEPPTDRVDSVAFAGKALADELLARLDGLGMACTRLLVRAESDHGEHHERVWCHEGALGAAAVAERVRWQLDGWLHWSAAVRPTAGISRLELVPDEVVPARGRQLGFWGGSTAAADRAARGVARVQGLLGPEAVAVPELRGGRGPGERVALVPAGAVDLSVPRQAVAPGASAAPWPGQVPAPAPGLVPVEPVPVQVVDEGGVVVAVSGRGLLVGVPHRLAVGGSSWVVVEAWAGPWPADERWWDPRAHRRRARFQVIAGGRAHLLVLERGRWWLEATYD